MKEELPGLKTLDWSGYYPPAREAEVQVLTEPEFAALRREEGARVVEHRGRYWQEILPGFYEPLPYLARLRAEEATRPTWRCWGYRAALADEDMAEAEAAMPIHIIRDLQSYGEWALKRQQKQDLRRALKEMVFLHLTDSVLLEHQGYDVYSSHARRLNIRCGLQKSSYLEMIRNWTKDCRQLVIVGLCNGVLCGYGHSYLVEDTGYLATLHIATEALQTNVGVALYFIILEVMQRRKISLATSGLHRPENKGLAVFKRRVGFELTNIPCRFSVPPLVASGIRTLRPYTYYRFTGRVPQRIRESILGAS